MKTFIFQKAQWFSRYISPAMLALIIVALAGISLFFIPPINGLADNGSYYLILDANGLYIQNQQSYQYNDYFQLQYGIRQYFNETSPAYYSSSFIFIQIALFLNKIFYSTTLFDLRFLAGLYLVIYLGAVYLLTRALTYRISKGRSYLFAVVSAFILGDGTLLIYFQSFYSEAVGLIGFIYFVGSLIYFTRVKQKFINLVIFPPLAMLLMVTAKQSYLPFLVGSIIIYLGLLVFLNNGLQRLSLMSSIISVAVLTLFLGMVLPKVTYQQDLYHSLNRGVLLDAEEPEEILAAAGVNLQFSLLQNSSYYAEYSPAAVTSNVIQDQLLGGITYRQLALSYLQNPLQVQRLLIQAAEDFYIVKPDDLGNYQKKDATTTEQQTYFFSVYNRITAAIFPKRFAFYMLLMAVLVGINGVGFYVGFKNRKRWMQLRFFIVTGIALNFILSFFSAILIYGDADLVHHLFLGNVALDLLILITLAGVFGKRIWYDQEDE